MEIKEHRLLAFIELYKELHGIALTPSEAHEKATLMLRYALLCIKPFPKSAENDIIIMSNENE